MVTELSSFLISFSIQSLGEYQRTKSANTEPGLAALNDSISDNNEALCMRALRLEPSADVPNLNYQINLTFHEGYSF